MRRSSGDELVNMPPPLDSDTPDSSASALLICSATERAGGACAAICGLDFACLTFRAGDPPRNAAAVLSTVAKATPLIVAERLICLA